MNAIQEAVPPATTWVIEEALAMLSELAEQKYIRHRAAVDQAQADRWQEDPGSFLSEGIRVRSWDEADTPLFERVLRTVESFECGFLDYIFWKGDEGHEEERGAFAEAGERKRNVFNRWFAQIRAAIAIDGIEISSMSRLHCCGTAVEHQPVPFIGAVRALILLSTAAPPLLRTRATRAAIFVATLFFLQMIDKKAGEWTSAHRRVDPTALRGRLRKIDALWREARKLAK